MRNRFHDQPEFLSPYLKSSDGREQLIIEQNGTWCRIRTEARMKQLYLQQGPWEGDLELSPRQSHGRISLGLEVRATSLFPALLLYSLAIFTFFAFSPLLSRAEENGTVWRLGTFDYSSSEFAGSNASVNSEHDVVFHVGQNPQTEWPAFQGVGDRPRTIQFTLDQLAQSYRIRVAVLFERPSVPALEVTVNGHAGQFYFHPKLDYHGGDLQGSSRVGYSWASSEFDVPASFLRIGSNSVTLQAIATSTEKIPEAGLSYDAIEMKTADHADTALVDVEPTIFYHQQLKGLTEDVHLFVRSGPRTSSGDITMELGGHSFQKQLKGNHEFGEERLEFSVPEFVGTTEVKTTLSINGKTTVIRQNVSASRKWTLYIVSHVHLDLSYTDFMPKVATVQSRMLDEAMDLQRYYPAYRYSTDGHWVLDQFLNTRTPAEQERLISALKERRIYSPASVASILTGFPTAEVLIRSLYDAADFSQRNGTPFDYTTITDVPSYSWSYASILGAAGIKYFTAGSDNIRGPVLLHGRLNERSPFWWEGPDGNKVLCWYAFVYRQVQMLFGLPPTIAAGQETLPIFLQAYDEPEYLAHAAIIYGTYGENRDLDASQAALAQRWNARFAYPRLEYAGVKDAMTQIEKQFGDANIPTFRGDGGPFWEDGIGGNPVDAAVERSTERRATSAEKIATISSILNPRVSANKAELGEMWKNILLFDEHTGVPLINQPDHDSQITSAWWETKHSFAETARLRAQSLLQNSMATVADSISPPSGSLVVFNMLNWKRDGEVTCDLPTGYGLIDAATNQPVTLRVLEPGSGFDRVEFTAHDVPGLGYKTYFQRHVARKAIAAAESTTLLENQFYRVEIDRNTAAIRSFFDKDLKRELVDTESPYRFGQYLYVTGGDDTPTTTVQYTASTPPPHYLVTGASGGRALSVEQTEDGQSAHLESFAPDQKIQTEIRLFDDRKQVEFLIEVNKQEVFHKESAYVAFPFAINTPQFQYEIQNGVVNPDKDMLPGAGQEWFSVQHWISVQQPGVSGTVMPLDTPLATLGDISRRLWLQQFGNRKATIFSYVYNNYHQPAVPLIDWHSPPKFDTLRVRLIVTSAPTTDPVELSRRGWEEATPLEANWVERRDKSWARPPQLNVKLGSFLTVEDPALLVQAWKPAENGKGTILRLLDLGGKERRVTVRTPLLNLTKVIQTDAVERNHSEVALSDAHSLRINVYPHEIITLRLIGSSVLSPPIIPPDRTSQGDQPYSEF